MSLHCFQVRRRWTAENLSKDAQMKKAWIVALVIALLPAWAGAVTTS